MLGQLLSAVREHAEWVQDQKRLEYRQLLDQLHETFTTVTFSNSQGILIQGNDTDVESLQSVQQLSRVFADRIFIADQLKASGALEDWDTLRRSMYEASRAHWPALLVDLRDQLRETLLTQAKTDIVKFKYFGLIPEE